MIDGRIAQEGEIVTVSMDNRVVFITTLGGEHHKARVPKFGVNSIDTACNHREPHLALFGAKTPEGLKGVSFRAKQMEVVSSYLVRSSCR